MKQLITNFTLHLKVQLIYTDKDFVYEGFFTDFGPLHLGHLYRYCHMLRSHEQQNPGVCIVHCTGRDPEKRANAAYLAGAYALLYHGLTPKQICEALTNGPDAIPFKPFQVRSRQNLKWYLFFSFFLSITKTQLFCV